MKTLVLEVVPNVLHSSFDVPDSEVFQAILIFNDYVVALDGDCVQSSHPRLNRYTALC